MNRFILLGLLSVALISFQACLFNSNSDNDDPGEPFITGIITDLEIDNRRILVEENPDVNGPLDNGGNKIRLSINDDTSIYRNNNFELVKCDFSCLQVNNVVSAWVTGAVAESYPLQGAASRIVINGEKSDS
jgi:hypothetical protein